MKLTCVIASLGCGGAERTLSTLINLWADTSDVTVLTFDDGTKPPFFSIDPRVVRRAMALEATATSLGRGALNNIRRVRCIRAALREVAPDVVVSFGDQTNVLTLLAARFLDLPVVVSERVDPRRYDPGAVWRLLRRMTYRWADAIVVQTERTRAHFARHTSAPLVVIPNPVPVVDATHPDNPPNNALILAVGRLEDQKGFDVLLRAFARMSPRFSDWRLVILGDGPRRSALEGLARELGISERVRLAGFVSDTHSLFRQAGIFALSSRFEGFPNALAEAMAHGCAAVAADCPTGPAELIGDGISGLLVEVDDVVALTSALERLANSPELRITLGTAAQRAVAQYRPDKILLQWNLLLSRVASQRQRAA